MQQNPGRPIHSVFAALAAEHGWAASQSTDAAGGNHTELRKDGLLLFLWSYHADGGCGVRLVDRASFEEKLPEWYKAPSPAEMLQAIGVEPLGSSEDFVLVAEHAGEIEALLNNRAWHQGRIEQQMDRLRGSYRALTRLNHPQAEELKSGFLRRYPWAAERTN